jgi:cyclopropane fatty-acyl-phospholipid synthase-like methyltransferase
MQRDAANRQFAFGKNWASYAALIGESQIVEAERALLKLFPDDQLRGRSFLDIGCGSGLHALAAFRLGAGAVTAIDIDPNSVATTRAVLARYNVACSVHEQSVFDVTGCFDVVYSWGVLHHTGNMWRAIEKASSLVAPGGLLAIALYRRTKSDVFWIREKRWYAGASPAAQAMARTLYLGLYRCGCLLNGMNYNAHVAAYKSKRGMDFHHDVHDWLGGYPYETASAPEVEQNLTRLGFTPERVFPRPMTWGLLGSGCDEYVYRRPA